MEKLDKVIAGMEACNGVGDDCNSCPYAGEGEKCSGVLWADTLAVLKARKGDLISRSEVLKFPIRRDHYDRENGNPHFINGIETVMEYIENIPAVEAEPVVRGRWEKHGKHDWRCSVCKIGVPYSFTGHHYCHNCGAHMDEEVAE